MLGFHFCVSCRRLIWPWQRYGFLVYHGRIEYWHGGEWSGRP